MRRVFAGLIAALFILMIGVAVVKFWRSTPDVAVEQPPCRNCAALYASGPVTTVGFCEFASNPGRYANQLVRFRAIFTNDAAQTTLSPPGEECKSETRLGMMTGIDEHGKACAGARKALAIYSGFETWYDSRAVVVVVGRSGRISNPTSYYHDEEGFNILCVEQVEPIGSGERERKNYQSWFFRRPY